LPSVAILTVLRRVACIGVLAHGFVINAVVVLAVLSRVIHRDIRILYENIIVLGVDREERDADAHADLIFLDKAVELLRTKIRQHIFSYELGFVQRFDIRDDLDELVAPYTSGSIQSAGRPTERIILVA